MSNTNELQPSLKPPFDVEFPNSERNLPDNIERAIEQGVMTPAMVGYRSENGSIKIPLSEEEVDELSQTTKRFAEKHGGRPEDWDWRYQ